jgi:hypothetical protein
MIYVVQFVKSGNIRVGYGKDEYHVGRRIKQHRVDAIKSMGEEDGKIKVICVFEGGYEDEQAILRQWAHLIIRGLRETLRADPDFLGWALAQKQVNAVFPVEVRPAKKPLPLTLTQYCIDNGGPRETGACTMALAILEQYSDHYVAVDVCRTRILLIRDDGVAIMYGVPSAMRKAQISLDDEGAWDTSLVPPGDYVLPVPSRSVSPGGRPNRHHLYGGKGKKRQTAKRSSRPVIRFDRMLANRAA